MDITEFTERVHDLAKQRGRTVPGNQAGSTVGSPVQGMQDRLRKVLELAVPGQDLSRYVIMDVGDHTVVGPDGGYNVATSLPAASDLWYLTIGDSIIPFRGEDHRANAEKILGLLAKYLERLDNIKPLKGLRDYKDLKQYYTWQETRTTFSSENAPYVIREMRFETWMFNRSTEFPSKGPKASIEAGVTSSVETSMGQLYSGLLSFPVGPLGVMEVLSIFSESMIDMLHANSETNRYDAAIPFSPDGTIQIQDPVGWRCVTEPVLDGFMSPMTSMKDECIGVHLVDKGYLVTSRDVEYPAPAFPGYDKILPLQSMRYYLRRDAKWPLPGEFIGLLARPWPSHVWWFQETSPILYSGNWVETNHYTSGVITEILQPPEGSFGLVYKCNVRGVEVFIASSDFYGYAVGDRVAIVRLGDLDRFHNSFKGNYKWKEMEDLIAREKMEKNSPTGVAYQLNPNMMILPVSFYKP